MINGCLIRRLSFSDLTNPSIRDLSQGDVGVNVNYVSHASTSVISSILAIPFTDDVVIPRKRAADAPVYPNFRPAT